MLAAKAITPTQRPVVIYGLDMLIYTLISFAVLVTFGALSNMAVQTVVWIGVQFPIQTFGGGYHATSHARCLALMGIGWVLFWFVYSALPILPLLIIATAWAGVLCVIGAIEHKNAPMSDSKKKRMTAYLRCSVVVLLMSMFLLLSVNQELSRIISLGIINCGISSAAAKVTAMQSARKA